MKAKVHFVAMAGLHGYLPQYLASHRSYREAIEDLAQLHELGKKRRAELRRSGYLELNLKRDGDEYCEVVECACDDPDSHNE